MSYQTSQIYRRSHPEGPDRVPFPYRGALGEDSQYRPYSRRDNEYSIDLIARYSDFQNCSLGASRLSTLIYKGLVVALIDYSTKTASDWGKLLRSANQHEHHFNKLALEWRSSRGVTSSLTQIAMDPAYQQIIGMGELAVPFIFRELEKEPDHWFWALKSITGTDPVSDGNRGNLRQMTLQWLEWGRERGYQW